MSINNRTKALAVASAGAYATAVYFTYQFLTPAPDENETPGTTTPCSCNRYTTAPDRTQTFQTLSQTYDDQINRDEIAMGLPLLRRALLYFHARGSVLEVGAGTGRNIDYYPSSPTVERVVLTDASDRMLLRAREKLRDVDVGGERFGVFVADAARVTDYYEEDTFDTVVDTFGLCSFDDPVGVLKELRRVCRPGGKILLLEHGRSKKWQGLSNYLDRHAERHAKNWGCVWNRDIDRMLHDAGLEVKTLDTWHFGTTYYAVCGPGDKVQLTKEREVEKEEKLGTDPKEEHTDETGRDGRGAIVGWWKRMWVRVPSNRE